METSSKILLLALAAASGLNGGPVGVACFTIGCLAFLAVGIQQYWKQRRLDNVNTV